MKKILSLLYTSLSLVLASEGAYSQEVYHTLEEKKAAGLAEQIGENLKLGGLIEVEAGMVNDDYNGDSSDIVLATVEIRMDAKINNFVKGNVLLLYEEDDTEEFTVDEGTITVIGPFGEFLKAGKMYVPFGVFNSHFISDPQTLELGEINESAFMAGYDSEKMTFSVGAFNGSIHKSGDDDKVDDYFVSINVTPVKGITFGASYLSDIADTDADIAVAFGNLSTHSQGFRDTVAGYSAYVSFSFGPVTLDTEYLAAADKFDAADLDADNDLSGDQPVTYNVELAFSAMEKLELALKYGGNKEFFEFPEKQYGAALSYALYENTTVKLEYLKGEYDSDYVPAGQDKVSSVTGQLAIEF